MARVDLHGIRKSFGAVDVIRSVDLSIREGEFLVLVGPSGCGKSTLLRCIAGLEKISAGEIMIGGQAMTHAGPAERGVAMVFQSYALYPHMTVAENIGFGLKIAGTGKKAIAARVREVAQLLRLDHLLARRPKELSGGQRQRVAIGRALARKPPIFLFDEPLSNLDASLRGEMRVELAKLHSALGNTMIYVTHDQVEAMTLADRIVVMRAGLIEQAGTPLDLFNNPANKFVAGFLGQPPMNFVRIENQTAAGDGLHLGLPGGRSVTLASQQTNANTRIVEIGIRPEDVTIVADGGDLAMTVDVVEHLGGETIAHGHLDDGQIFIARLPGQCALRADDLVSLALSRPRLMAFDTEGRNICFTSA